MQTSTLDRQKTMDTADHHLFAWDWDWDGTGLGTGDLGRNTGVKERAWIGVSPDERESPVLKV